MTSIRFANNNDNDNDNNNPSWSIGRTFAG